MHAPFTPPFTPPAVFHIMSLSLLCIALVIVYVFIVYSHLSFHTTCLFSSAAAVFISLFLAGKNGYSISKSQSIGSWQWISLTQ
jgi:hypothetical protein